MVAKEGEEQRREAREGVGLQEADRKGKVGERMGRKGTGGAGVAARRGPLRRPGGAGGERGFKPGMVINEEVSVIIERTPCLPSSERQLNLTFLSCKWLLAANKTILVKPIAELEAEEASQADSRMIWENARSQRAWHKTRRIDEEGKKIFHSADEASRGDLDDHEDYSERGQFLTLFPLSSRIIKPDNGLMFQGPQLTRMKSAVLLPRQDVRLLSLLLGGRD
ncbi:uncharacterized protein A4U43_C02F15850 [Asparagus officinalis]|uniref:Uncharacterized protein n=1 Tax=Asparagus officinalis TaxID=4686 RepID=A0A5P1FIR6_ASPOF|nr:uncharacterized protein A4U43_C02F15850 [Asparagus officinalis]